MTYTNILILKKQLNQALKIANTEYRLNKFSNLNSIIKALSEKDKTLLFSHEKNTISWLTQYSRMFSSLPTYLIQDEAFITLLLNNNIAIYGQIDDKFKSYEITLKFINQDALNYCNAPLEHRLNPLLLKAAVDNLQALAQSYKDNQVPHLEHCLEGVQCELEHLSEYIPEVLKTTLVI